MSTQPTDTEQMVPLSYVNDVIREMQITLETRTRALNLAMQSDNNQKNPDEIIKTSGKFEQYLINGVKEDSDKPLTGDSAVV